MALELIFIVLLLLLPLNAWATQAVLRDALSSREQRIAQIVFVWLVPLIGALLTLYLKRAELEPPTGRYREEPDPGDDFSHSRPRTRRNNETSESDQPSSVEGAESD